MPDLGGPRSWAARRARAGVRCAPGSAERVGLDSLDTPQVHPRITVLTLGAGDLERSLPGAPALGAALYPADIVDRAPGPPRVSASQTP
jgi:hypothetical protein